METDRKPTQSRHGLQRPDLTEREARELRELTARVVASFVCSQPLPASELPELIKLTYQAFADLGRDDAGHLATRIPAVPIDQSVADDFIVCLEDGRRLKTLKRYIRHQYGLTPQQYRARWGLSPDYPMVAPSYARLRSSLARRAIRDIDSPAT